MASTSKVRLTLICAALMASTAGVHAADVTFERLRNPEPHNWLMNHHDFGSQRYSALDMINKSNVKNLKLAFAVPLGGTSGNEYVEATPLVDDGMMYITNVWGVVYKIDVTSGNTGRIVWKMDPGQQKPDRNRGVALWNNLVISVTGYDGRVIATDKETGNVVWDKKLSDQPDLEFTAAPLALKDTIVIGASGGDNGVRNWLAGIEAKSGDLQWKTFVVPAPGEPGSETWKDKTNAWQTGGGALYVTGSYDPLLDGTIVAYDDQTLEELWKINVGTGFVAPPMTYAVNGKQYIAIASGIGNVAKAKLARSPEMKNQPNATMLFVFGL